MEKLINMGNSRESVGGKSLKFFSPEMKTNDESFK